MIKIYTDGSCLKNPGSGGWAAVIIENGQERVISGSEKYTTNNQMELLATIKALEEFSNKEKCYEHIHNNLVELKKYAASEFGPATPVKMIDCFKKNEI